MLKVKDHLLSIVEKKQLFLLLLKNNLIEKSLK